MSQSSQDALVWAGLVVAGAIALGLYYWAIVVCFQKGKSAAGWVGVAGIVLPVLDWVAIGGAIRLARPESDWARRRYDAEKLGRAIERHGGEHELAYLDSDDRWWVNREVLLEMPASHYARLRPDDYSRDYRPGFISVEGARILAADVDGGEQPVAVVTTLSAGDPAIRRRATGAAYRLSALPPEGRGSRAPRVAAIAVVGVLALALTGSTGGLLSVIHENARQSDDLKAAEDLNVAQAQAIANMDSRLKTITEELEGLEVAVDFASFISEYNLKDMQATFRRLRSCTQELTSELVDLANTYNRHGHSSGYYSSYVSPRAFTSIFCP